MSTPRHLGGGAIAMLVAALGAWTPAAEIPALSGIVAVADAKLDLELVAATATPDGARTWLALAARPKGQPTSAATVQLVSIGATALVSKTDVAIEPAEPTAATPERPARRSLLQGLAVTTDGSVVLGLARGQAPVSLLRVGAVDRRAAASIPLTFKTDADLTGLLRLPNGQLLAIGTNGRPVVAEVTPAGAATWERVLPIDGVRLESVSVADDGGLMVVGRSGADATTAKLWVATLSPKGEVLAQSTFPGHDGEIARLRDGSAVLVFDRVVEKGFDVFVKTLGPDLRERSTTPLMSAQLTSGAFRIAATPDGGYLIAGVRDRGRYVARFDATGKERWSDSRPPAAPSLEIVTRVELLVRGRTVLLPYAAFVVEGREQRQVVRVARFTLE